MHLNFSFLTEHLLHVTNLYVNSKVLRNCALSLGLWNSDFNQIIHSDYYLCYLVIDIVAVQ